MRAVLKENGWARAWSLTPFLIGIFHLFPAQAQNTLTDPTGHMMTPRESHTATLLKDGNVLVVGGMNWEATIGCPAGQLCLSALASAELFNPATGTFASAGHMSAPRVYHTATLLTNGKVLIAGGDDEKTTAYATAQIFDPASGLFTSTGNMIAVHTGHTATLLADGKVLVAGGGNRAGSDTEGSATAELYDPATGKFKLTGNMNVSRTLHTATLLSDGRVLIAGGYSPDLTAELYNPATGTFTLTGSMSISRLGHTATLLANGEVLVTGGQYGRVATATTELFNPATGVFTPAGSMLSMREGGTATRLNDGKVLVTGGINRNRIWSSAEVFNPANGTFTLAGNMETERNQHTATLLMNGEVLITGGINFDNAARLNSLATAELAELSELPPAPPGTKVLQCPKWKVVAPAQSIEMNVSPNASGIPGLCIVAGNTPKAYYVKTTTNLGASWQWVYTLGQLGLGK
jgi:hypothetical protein